MQKGILALGSLLAIASPSPAQSTAYDYHHVQGGFINGISMFNATDGVCVQEGGRIEFTIDGGATWVEANVPLAYREELRGVYLSGSEAWAVGNGGAVLKSSNSGIDWSWLNETNPIMTVHSTSTEAELFDIWMLNANDGWVVGNDGGVWYTNNGWVTYAHSPYLPVSDFYDSIDAADGYGIVVIPDSPYDSDSNPGAVIVADNGHIIYTDDATTPGSTVWISSTINTFVAPPSGHYLEFWSTDFDSNGFGYAVGGFGNNGGVMFHSDDYGVTWTQDPLAAYKVFSATPGDDDFPPSCGLPTVYGVSILSDGYTLSGTSTYVPPIADMVGYGSSIYRYNPNLAGATYPVFDQASCSGPTTSSSAVWEQIDPQAKSPVNGRPPFTSIYAVDADHVWHTGQFGNIRKYNPSTSLWDEQGSVGGIRLNAGDFSSATNGCVIGQGLIIKHTTDGGQTWTNVTTPASAGEFGRDLDLTPSGYGMAVGTSGFMSFTNDGGATWNSMTAPFSVPSGLIGVEVDSATGIAYFCGVSGKIGKVDLASLSDPLLPDLWYDVSISGVSSDINGMSFVDANTGYAVGQDMVAYFTSNGGTSWSAVGVLPAVSGEDFLAVKSWGSGTQAIAVGTNGIVYEKTSTRFVPISGVSAATGTDWRDLYSVEVLNSGADIIIGGENGRVLHYESSSWKEPKSQTNEPIFSVAFSASNQGFLIGKKFIIIEYRP